MKTLMSLLILLSTTCSSVASENYSYLGEYITDEEFNELYVNYRDYFWPNNEGGFSPNWKKRKHLSITYSAESTSIGSISFKVLQVLKDGILAIENSRSRKTIFLAGLDMTGVIDGDSYTALVRENGILKYNTVLGASKTVKKYEAISRVFCTKEAFEKFLNSGEKILTYTYGRPAPIKITCKRCGGKGRIDNPKKYKMGSVECPTCLGKKFSMRKVNGRVETEHVHKVPGVALRKEEIKKLLKSAKKQRKLKNAKKLIEIYNQLTTLNPNEELYEKDLAKYKRIQAKIDKYKIEHTGKKK